MMAEAGIAERFRSALVDGVDRLGGVGSGVLGVSGGADSTALFCGLVGRGNVIVAHVNHRLRGADSDADAEFVRRLAGSAPYREKLVDIASVITETGENLEEAARRIRYEFFVEIAREFKCTWVATAHTLDDQAETVLHRLIRGSGLRGLRGIGRSNEMVEGIRLIRPLLDVNRSTVEEFLHAIGVSWRTDASNADPRFTRNRIRHQLLPLMKELNSDVTAVLARTADQAGDWWQEWIRQAEEVRRQSEAPRAGLVVVLRILPHEAAADAIAAEALRIIWDREGWPAGQMTGPLWEIAVAVWRGNRTAWDFPGGVRMQGRHTVVNITYGG